MICIRSLWFKHCSRDLYFVRLENNSDPSHFSWKSLHFGCIIFQSKETDDKSVHIFLFLTLLAYRFAVFLLLYVRSSITLSYAVCIAHNSKKDFWLHRWYLRMIPVIESFPCYDDRNLLNSEHCIFAFPNAYQLMVVHLI